MGRTVANAVLESNYSKSIFLLLLLRTVANAVLESNYSGLPAAASSGSTL